MSSTTIMNISVNLVQSVTFTERWFQLDAAHLSCDAAISISFNSTKHTHSFLFFTKDGVCEKKFGLPLESIGEKESITHKPGKNETPFFTDIESSIFESHKTFCDFFLKFYLDRKSVVEGRV